MNEWSCHKTVLGAHFSNTLIEVDISLNTLDFINGELENSPLAIFRSSLLFSNVKSTL